jgi:hypothetical protein
MATEAGRKLISNILLDDILVMAHAKNDYDVGKLRYLWARELLVHPKEGGVFKKGVFKKGKDVVDSETGWCLPGNYLTDPRYVNEDVFREGTGLFVDPEDVRKDGRRIVVIPASIVVLHPFIQGTIGWGIMDEATRIPLADKCMDRWLCRIRGAGVRPIGRYDEPTKRRVVSVEFEPDAPLGVLMEPLLQVPDAASKTL